MSRKRLLLISITIVLLVGAGIVWILSVEGVLQGSWTNSLTAVFGILGVLFAFLQWTFPVSPAESKRPPGSSKSDEDTLRKEDLRLVDISIIEEESRLATLDFKLRNVGAQVAFLKRAEFKILDVAEIYSCDKYIAPITGALAVPSAIYDIELSPGLKGMSKSVNISQSLASNDVDRFQFILSQDWEYPRDAEIECRWYYLKIVLVYNDTDQIVETKPLLLRLESSPPPNGSWTSVKRSPEQGCIQHNEEVIRTMAKLKAIRSFSVESAITTLLGGKKRIGDTLTNQTDASSKDVLISPKSIAPPTNPTLQYTLEGHTGRVNSMAWSPDGKLLASGADDKTIRLWNSTTSALLYGHMRGVNSVAWSPDGKLLASGAEDSTVRVWNPTTGRLLHTLVGHTGRVNSVAWSPVGILLASDSTDSTVRVWNPTTGRLLHILEGHTGEVRSMAWSPNSKLLATGATDSTVRVWNPSTGELAQTLSSNSTVRSVAWSPDGNVLACGCDDLRAKMWGTGVSLPVDQTGLLEGKILTRAVSSVAWSPDGKLLASSGIESSVRVWNSTTGGLLYHLEGHTGEVRSVVWSPDGKLLVSSSSTNSLLDDAEVRIWRTDTWEPLVLLAALKGCIDVSWHPRFSTMVTVGQREGDIFVWHLDLSHLLHML